jgi:hypothetical protein
MEIAYLSPTKLERFRKFVEEQPEYISHDSLVAMIRNEQQRTPALDLGVGFHAALEHGPEQFWNPERGQYLVTSRDLPYPQVFTESQMALVYRFRARYQGLTAECSFVWDRVTPAGRRFKARMRMDGVYGLEVHEHKTTSRPVSVEQFERSLQWRLYLAVTGAQLCQYNIFEFGQAEPGQEMPITAEVYRQYAYPGMEAEILDWVDQYLDFVEQHELRSYVYRAA